ncbi:MAG TPA: hypothetical protein VFR37_10735 [Longimicrobium sp.]|nr:hypothetical protein [Longimicrobium sp.]
MPLNTGTYTLEELLAVKDQRLVEFGEDRILEALQADLDFHNASVEEQIEEFATPTTDLIDRYGTNDQGGMEEADEFTQPITQVVRVGDQVGYPLRKFVRGVGWTNDYLEAATVADLAKDQLAVEADHIKAVGRALARALLRPGNYTFFDKHAKRIEIAVKALVNADGGGIPNGPNGEEFDPDTHTHYDAINWATATADQRAQAMEDLVADLVEHGHGDEVRIYINQKNETQVRAVPGFVRAEYALVRAAADRDASTLVLDTSRQTNRVIGSFNGVEVWTKPWAPFNYQIAHARGDARKPLKFRQSTIPERRGLRLGGTIRHYPLQTDNFEAWYGFGAYTRTAASVLYMGGAVYAEPNI